MKVTLLGMLVWLKPEVITEKNGIALSRGSWEMPKVGVITHIGKGAAEFFKNQQWPIEVGSRVLYDQHHQQLDTDWSKTEIKAEVIKAVLDSKAKIT